MRIKIKHTQHLLAPIKKRKCLHILHFKSTTFHSNGLKNSYFHIDLSLDNQLYNNYISDETEEF